MSPPILNQSGSVVIVQVTPGTGPQIGGDEERWSRTIRNQSAPFEQVRPERARHRHDRGQHRYRHKLGAALPVFLPLIVILALIVLLLVFRSLLVPVKAVVGFLLTIAAAFGFVVWVFQDGNLNSVLGVPATSPVTSFLPIIMIAILFGLAMDYEVFLVSRMRESYLRTSSRPSVIEGFSAGSRVVTAAAIIMFSVFASFITGDDLMVKSFGAVLAFGVAFDAFLVRMTLVPAVLAMVKDRAWHLPGLDGPARPGSRRRGRAADRGARPRAGGVRGGRGGGRTGAGGLAGRPPAAVGDRGQSGSSGTHGPGSRPSSTPA